LGIEVPFYVVVGRARVNLLRASVGVQVFGRMQRAHWTGGLPGKGATMGDELERRAESEEGEEIQELMDDALPERLDDDRLEDQEEREPGLDAV